MRKQRRQEAWQGSWPIEELGSDRRGRSKAMARHRAAGRKARPAAAFPGACSPATSGRLGCPSRRGLARPGLRWRLGEGGVFRLEGGVQGVESDQSVLQWHAETVQGPFEDPSPEHTEILGRKHREKERVQRQGLRQ